MKTRLRRIPSLVLVMVFIAACSKATPTETPVVDAPAPNMAGGVYQQAGYQVFHWIQGLTVLVWHDMVQSSVCSGSTTTSKGENITTCSSVNSDGETFDWQIETSDGMGGRLTFNGINYDLVSNNVFTISTQGETVLVKMFKRDLSSITLERESIIKFTNDDLNLLAFLKYVSWKNYSNSDFGLTFHYPADWYGPDVYTVDQDLRIQIGSDVVYPYGTDRTGQIYTLKDSYYILVDYDKSEHDLASDDLYQLMVGLQNGESYSDARSKITRVRWVSLGNFDGFEFISTLSETAQTEIFYVRQVILYGPNGSVLRVTGQPNNVEMSDKSQWRSAYKAVDEANRDLFQQVLDSIEID